MRLPPRDRRRHLTGETRWARRHEAGYPASISVDAGYPLRRFVAPPAGNGYSAATSVDAGYPLSPAGARDGQLATAMLSTSTVSGRDASVIVVASVWIVRVKCPTVRIRTDSDSIV